MYRRDVGGEQCHFKERLVFLIYPNYFYEYENVLTHIRKSGFGIVRKVARVIQEREAADWVGEYSRLSEFIADGPSMLLLVERANPFLSIYVIVEEHNATSMRMNGKIGVYASADTIQAQRDIRFFFTDLYDEKKFFDNTTIYFNELILPKLRPALAELSIRRPDDPIVRETYKFQNLKRTDRNKSINKNFISTNMTS
uniref:Nucleoside diphosphate kinase-like domain-containing protein n=1 Tax=Ascaris lumbricoides TaxID=6252 RepID=A0A0M3IIN4_ASCLU